MIVSRPSKSELPEAQHGYVANLSDVVLRLRSLDEAAQTHPSDFDLSNVVPFARGRPEPSAVSPAISVSPADRLRAALATGRGRMAAFIICSFAVHVGLYLPFMREPDPMSSIGEIAITAEIVLGANTPAGNAAQTGDAEASAPTPAQDPVPQPDAKPEPELAQAEPPKPEPELEVAKAEPQLPELQSVEPPTESEPQKFETAAIAPTPEEQPSVKLQAPVEAVPEDVKEAPAEVQAAPQETPSAPELQAAVRPVASIEFRAAQPVVEQKKPELSKPVAKPQPKKPAETRKPVAKPEKQKRAERRVAARGESNDSQSAAPASTAASGVGRGRSDLNTNYRGLVAAHLARFKQFPADARGRGDTGSATVTFGLSGSGGVTSVQLVRGTGVGSLDQEATAMVRRASPFPAPPDGRAQSFTVPVSFRIQ